MKRFCNPLLSIITIVAASLAAAQNGSATHAANEVSRDFSSRALNIFRLAQTTAAPGAASKTAIARINAGSFEFVDLDGNKWSEDTFDTGDGRSNFTVQNTATINGTTNDALYRSERYGVSFNYSIPVPAGEQLLEIVLHFAEIFFTQPNQRVFSVSIEGATVLGDFDMIAEIGAAFTAEQYSTTARVTDGFVTIAFASTINFAKISGIEIFDVATTAPVAVTPTQGPVATSAPVDAPTGGPLLAPVSTTAPVAAPSTAPVSAPAATTAPVAAAPTAAPFPVLVATSAPVVSEPVATSAPVADPTTAPVPAPVATAMPVADPTMAPVPAPVATAAPVATPITAPAPAPVATTVPLAAPTTAPAPAPVTSAPVAAPTTAPVPAPVVTTDPMAAPTTAPVPVPIVTKAPTLAPVPAPVVTTAPVAVPISAPVVNPIATPAPVSPAPVVFAVGEGSSKGASVISSKGASMLSSKGASVISSKTASTLSSKGASVISSKGAGVTGSKGASGLGSKVGASSSLSSKAGVSSSLSSKGASGLSSKAGASGLSSKAGASSSLNSNNSNLKQKKAMVVDNKKGTKVKKENRLRQQYV